MQSDEILKLIEEAARTGQTDLDLSGNRLNGLPAEITQLTNLTTLDMDRTNLSELPAEIGLLANLTTLYLNGNQLSELPPEIGMLANLTTLSLDGNQLSELPPEITQLANLNRLYLDRNQLSELPPEIGLLANLVTLSLDGNQLNKLPPEIGLLAILTTLSLDMNQLNELPPEITQLANLVTLSLNGNQISQLPDEITKLTNLIRLYLSKNPLKSPPPEIAGQGVQAIFEYLRRLPEKGTLVNEAKMILVGQGDVGKTCLAKRLIYDEFIEDKTTEGIDILKWLITAPTDEKEEIKLNVWDFGGQDIYHATHQFFLTKRSVYLLVWNARKARDYEHIYYWLHTIEAFGEDSPIILVLSKLNERNDDLNMTDIREKFPQIVDLYKVDSEDDKGIPALKDIISKTAWQLPHMQTVWIDSWFRVREHLEKMGEDWIGYSEFCNICHSEGLDKKQIDILDEYLHDLGVIIHFQDIILQDMVILKPEWATNAVYKILDTDAVKERDGILLHSELGQIWDTGIYPQNVYPKLLELMNKFELAYELPDKRSHLVAELLPSSEPVFEWNTTDNLCFYYRYDFLPAGLMTRFIVRLHRDLENKSDGTQLCWREGAVLCWENTRAFVKVKLSDKLIEIKINGSKKIELLAIIRRELDHINKSIKKAKITKEIPCSCSTDCSYKFDYEDLLHAKKKGIKTVQCQKNFEDVSLSLLLEGYERKERMNEIDETLKEKGINLTVIQNAEQRNVQTQKSNQEVIIDIDVKIATFHEIQSDFENFKDLLIELNPKFKEKLDKIGDSLDEVSADSDNEKLVKPLNKLGRFLGKLGDEESDYSKIISGSKNGIEMAQKLGKTYNKFAQWIALPVVPDLFLGK
jgi:small GTP-binding protein